MILHTCSVIEKSADHTSQGYILTLCTPCWVTTAVIEWRLPYWGKTPGIVFMNDSRTGWIPEWPYICSQGAGDNHECTPVVIGNCSQDHKSRCRSSLSRSDIGWPSGHLLTNIWLWLAPRQNRFTWGTTNNLHSVLLRILQIPLGARSFSMNWSRNL